METKGAFRALESRPGVAHARSRTGNEERCCVFVGEAVSSGHNVLEPQMQVSAALTASVMSGHSSIDEDRSHSDDDDNSRANSISRTRSNGSNAVESKTTSRMEATFTPAGAKRRTSMVMAGWSHGAFEVNTRPSAEFMGTALKQAFQARRAELAKLAAVERQQASSDARAEPTDSKPGTGSSMRSRLRDSRMGTGASRERKTETAATYDSYVNADELEKDNALLEGSYSEVIDEYGLTAEGVVQFEVMGLPKEQIRKLRSLFLSLDRDGGGELSAVELYDALRAFGQNITDNEVKAMLEEIDQDNSGTIGYEEFLLVTIPGTTSSSKANKRKLALQRYTSAQYQDPMSWAALQELEVPEQCFMSYSSELETTQKQQEPAVPGEDQADSMHVVPPNPNVTPAVSVDLRLRFKLKGAPSSKTTSARAGSLRLPVSIVKGRWVEKRYFFDDKELAPNDEHGQGLIFTAQRSQDSIGFPVPKNKLRWVKFPIAYPELFEGDYEIGGFPIVMISPDLLRITFNNFNRKASNRYAKFADFPPPPECITILESGAGSRLHDIRSVVAAKCNLPPWTPFRFTTRCKDHEGNVREQALKEDLGELKSLAGDTILIDVLLPGRSDLTQALLDFEASTFSWVPDIVSDDLRPLTSVTTEIKFTGASAYLDQITNLQLGLVCTDQVQQVSSSLNRAWLSCPPHPHIAPILLHAGPNLFLCPASDGISGSLLAHILHGSALREAQTRLILIKVGLQMAWGLEHMHDHGMWHLDLKPHNLLVKLPPHHHLFGASSGDERCWQRIHVSLCDWSLCSCFAGESLTRRGTPGFWAPEQVHEPTLADGERLENSYWGGRKCVNPPPPVDAHVSSRADSWGWATTMLALMGRLEGMRTGGFGATVQRLLDEGYAVDLSAIFLYEQEPYIAGMEKEYDVINGMYQGQLKAAARLQEDIDRHKLELQPMWEEVLKALGALVENDLRQVASYRRCPPLLKPLVEALGACLAFDRKDVSDWSKMRAIITTTEFVASLPNFDRFKGLSVQGTKQLTGLINSGDLQVDRYTESTVPNPSPTNAGSSLAVAKAYNAFVHAIHEFNLLRRTIGPINMELRAKQAEIDKTRPAVESLAAKVAEHRSELDRLTQNLADRSAEVIHTVHKLSKKDAVIKVAEILEMDGSLTAQQFRRLSKDVLYATGDHSYAATRLSTLPEPDVPAHEDEQEGEEGEPMEDSSVPEDLHLDDTDGGQDVVSRTLSATESGSSTSRTPRSARAGLSKPRSPAHSPAPMKWTGAERENLVEEDEEDVLGAFFERLPFMQAVLDEDGREVDKSSQQDAVGDLLSAPMQACQRAADPTGTNADADIYGGGDAGKQMKRHAILGTHTTDAGVGDVLKLVMAWCLQVQPLDRLPVHGVAMFLTHLSPRQEWLKHGTLPGRPGFARPRTEAAGPTWTLAESAPRYARAMLESGGSGDWEVELCLLERKAMALADARSLMPARDAYVHLHSRLLRRIRMQAEAEEPAGSEEGRGREHGRKWNAQQPARDVWRQLFRVELALCKLWQAMGNLEQAQHWLQQSEDTWDGARAKHLQRWSAQGGAMTVDLRVHDAQRVGSSVRLTPRALGSRQAPREEPEVIAGGEVKAFASLDASAEGLGDVLKSVLTQQKTQKAAASLGEREVSWWDVEEGDEAEGEGGSAQLTAQQEHVTLTLTRAGLLHETGKLLLAQGDKDGVRYWREAGWTFLEAAHLCRAGSGVQTLEEVDAMVGVARAKRGEGQWLEAVQVYDVALEVACRATGYDAYVGHSKMGEILVEAAEVQSALGQWEAATRGLERAAHIYTASGLEGAGGAPMGWVLAGLGLTYERAGRYGQAGRWCREAIEHCTRVLGRREGMREEERELWVAEVLVLRGTVRVKTGELAEAWEDFDAGERVVVRALVGKDATGDKDEDNASVARAECRMGKGVAREEQGRLWDALDCYQAVYHMQLERLGDELHFQLAPVCESLGRTMMKLSKHGLASDWLLKALKIRTRAQGNSHPETAATRASLAMVWLKEGRQEHKAASQARLASQAFIAAFGPRHSAVAVSLSNLALARYPLGIRAMLREEKTEAELDEQVAAAEEEVQRLEELVDVEEEKVQATKKLPAVKKKVVQAAERIRDEAQARVDDALAELYRLQAMQPERQERSEKCRAAVKEALALMQEAIDIQRLLLPPEHPSIRTYVQTLALLTTDFHELSLVEKSPPSEHTPPSPSSVSDYESRPVTGQSVRSVWAEEIGDQLGREALIAANMPFGQSLPPSRSSTRISSGI